MLFVLCSMRHHSSNIWGNVKIATLTTSRIAIMDVVGEIQRVVVKQLVKMCVRYLVKKFVTLFKRHIYPGTEATPPHYLPQSQQGTTLHELPLHHS